MIIRNILQAAGRLAPNLGLSEIRILVRPERGIPRDAGRAGDQVVTRVW